jgi:hypothetical protein
LGETEEPPERRRGGADGGDGAVERTGATTRLGRRRGGADGGGDGSARWSGRGRGRLRWSGRLKEKMRTGRKGDEEKHERGSCRDTPDARDRLRGRTVFFLHSILFRSRENLVNSFHQFSNNCKIDNVSRCNRDCTTENIKEKRSTVQTACDPCSRRKKWVQQSCKATPV